MRDEKGQGEEVMNNKARLFAFALLFSSFILHPSSFLWADGGTVRFSQRRDGYQVTVFTSPTPLRAGFVDISVFVQDATTGKPLTDVPVQVHAQPVGDPQRKVSAPATTEAATNKLFRAAQFELPEPGQWRVEVVVQGYDQPTAIDFEVAVAKAVPSWVNLSLWIGWPFAAVLLFGIHQVLVRRQRCVK
jgi:hypothetical protein